MFREGSLLLASFTSSAGGAATLQESTRQQEEIVVSARSGKSKPPPVDHYDAKSIDDLNALTIGEVLARLERRNGGRPLSVLINGKRLADISDIKEIPPEALQEIDIIDRSHAGSYGLTPNDNIVNLVLKPSFNSLALDAGYRRPTDGAGASESVGARYTKINKERRFNASLTAQRAAPIDGADREHLFLTGQTDPLIFYRTLLPSSQSVALSSGIALPVGPVSGNLSFTGTDARSRILSRFFNAAGSETIRAGSASARGIIDENHVRSYQLSATASGNLSRASWTAELSGNRAESRVSSAISPQTIDVAGSGSLTSLPRAFEGLNTTSRSSSLAAALSGSAPLLKLPAGEVTANVRVSGSVEYYKSGPLAAPAGTNTSTRRRFQIHNGLDVPLTSSSRGILGQTALNANVDYEQISGVGGLPAYDVSLFWQPPAPVSLTISRAVTKAQPTFANNIEPIIYTPGVLVVDAVTGQYEAVTRISGGTPDLQVSTQTSDSFRVTSSSELIGAKVTLTLEYASAAIAHPVIQVRSPSALFQQLFPARFIRDAGGRLSTIDVRPFNGSEETRKTVRSNMHVTGGIAGGDGHWDLSISHELALSARIKVAEKGHAIDLLQTPLDGALGVPRQRVNISAETSYKRLNVQLDAQWRSGTRAADPSSSEVQPLHFSSFWTADATISYTFRSRNGEPLGNGKPIRIWFLAQNILNRRQGVVGANGTISPASQNVFLDPIGRVVALRLSALL